MDDAAQTQEHEDHKHTGIRKVKMRNMGSKAQKNKNIGFKASSNKFSRLWYKAELETLSQQYALFFPLLSANVSISLVVGGYFYGFLHLLFTVHTIFTLIIDLFILCYYYYPSPYSI